MVYPIWKTTKEPANIAEETLSIFKQAVFLLHKNCFACFFSRWSIKNTKDMANEEAYDRHPGGRPKKPVKKESATGVRFSKSEYFIVKQKALKGGLKVTAYIRQMAVEGKVDAAMGEEERQSVRQLAGMANNLNQLAKKAHEEGLMKAMLLFSGFIEKLDQELKKIK